jgi:type IV fimbrial biogenesis protein FimT
MTRQNGFTLIELMITIGIAAILATMAVPGMKTLTLNSRQTAGINELVSGMHLARNTAITMNARVTMCPSSDGQSCAAVSWDQGWIAFVDKNSDQLVNADDTIVRAASSVTGLTISSGMFADYLMYRPSGRVMRATTGQNSGLFTSCDYRGAEHAKAIFLDLSGRPQVSDSYSGGMPLSCN